jgi:hypothetical protein
VATADRVGLPGSRATVRDLLDDAVANPDTDAIEQILIEGMPGALPFIAPERTGERQ